MNGVDHVNLYVKNLNQSIEFYTKYFGFQIKKDLRNSGHAGVILGIQSKLYLCMYELPNEKYQSSEVKINHLGFNVENFDETLQIVKLNQIPIPFDVIQYGVSRSFYITDPSGYEIEISEKFGGDLQ